MTGTHHQQVGRNSVGSSFQRRGEAWRKERLLIFEEEYKGGRAWWQHQKNERCDGVKEGKDHRDMKVFRWW